MTDALPTLTADNKRALRELRFVTVNKDRSRVIGLDKDPTKLAAATLAVQQYERSPGVYEFEGTSGDPAICAYVAKLLGLPHG